ncbi:DUF3293 domain-containing protein [Photobacterium sanctipauli]|uniref:DUF3293 domain-containing protein n=1 Tax=Photobacterium sanctipauli TaxID=1342794 RepID=A0A2T3NRZ2_9GAMM|nr:DUF3293 domain-containing protein [Photobacterium sanctipauli]PSW19012.1 DUF3293 domain-containing protein [Photobacterium sanctipauli]
MCEQLSLWCSYQSVVFNLKQHPVYPCFAILTAFNPRSIVISHQVNKKRHHMLVNELSTLTLQLRPISCSAIDGDWQELGVMAGLPLASAINLARRWGQNAIYWVEGNDLYLVPVLLQGHEIQRLGDWPSFLYT